jgi:penicillin-binding protein 1A
MGQGSKTARPIWAKFMTKVYDDPTLEYKKGEFKRPSSRLNINMDCNLYDAVDTDSTAVKDETPWNVDQ